MVRGREVFVRSWNRGMLTRRDRRYGLRKRVVERRIGVFCAASVARPPTRIHGELHEIGQPLLGPVCSGRLAARQLSEALEADRRATVRRQVAVDEAEMRELILGVVVDVLSHVSIELCERIRVGLVSSPAGYLAVLNATQLVVLLPEVGLENFERGKESENCSVALREASTRRCPERRQNASPHGAGANSESGTQKRAASQETT